MSEHKIQFGTLKEDGAFVNVRMLNQSDIRRCPHCMFVPDHYRADGSCRCDEKDYPEMEEWGYEWDGNSWVSPGEEE